MNIYKNTLFLSFLLLLLASCGKDDPDSPQEDTTVEIITSVPQKGTTVNPAVTTTVELVLNRELIAVNKSNITLNGKIVSEVTFNGDKLTISLPTLVAQTDYLLEIKANALRMEPGVFNSEILKLDFRTSEYPKATITPNLVVKNPSAQARKLYQYLIDTYQKKTISGMMANVAWNNTESERVYALTGKYPALNCYDYIHLAWSPANWIDYGDITPVKSWWTAGGIVSIGWHWNVPIAEGVTDPSQATCTPEKTTFRAKNALTEGTWENTIMKADLAKITTYLKLLQAEGIPVLWRPLHEAAGNTYEYTGGTAWFWWGYDGGETYKQLWQYMFNYFEKEGLNNLIWVWTTQTKDNAFYPGDAYVDIIGRDLYSQSTSNCALQYNTIVPNYPTKLVALSECGAVGLVSEQWAAGAYWSWFMPWYDNADATSAHATDAWWKDAMNQPFVISRDQLPNLK